MFVKLLQAFSGKAVGEQIDVSSEHADLLIKGGIAEAVQGDPLPALIEKHVGGMLESLTKGLNDTITETIKKIADAQTRSRKNAVPLLFGEQGEGDPRKNFGDFCLCIATKNVKRLDEVYGAQMVDEKGNIVHKAALAESSGSAGGYGRGASGCSSLASTASPSPTRGPARRTRSSCTRRTWPVRTARRPRHPAASGVMC